MKAAVIRSEYLCHRLKGRRDNLRARIKTLQRVQDLEPAASGDTMDHTRSCVDSEIRTATAYCANTSPGADLSADCANDVAAVAMTLNSRPGKALEWKTPAEALNQYLR
jgi:hypothetical protein